MDEDGGWGAWGTENSPGLFHILNCWAPRVLGIDFYFFSPKQRVTISLVLLCPKREPETCPNTAEVSNKPGKECTCKRVLAGVISPSVAIFLLTYLDLYHFRITKEKYFMNLKITYPSCIPSLWCKSRLAHPIWNVLGWKEKFLWFAFKTSSTFWVKSYTLFHILYKVLWLQ